MHCYFFDFIEICRGISWSVKGIRQTEGIPFIIHFSWICYASGIERFVKTCMNSFTIHKIQTVGSQRITGYVDVFRRLWDRQSYNNRSYNWQKKHHCNAFCSRCYHEYHVFAEEKEGFVFVFWNVVAKHVFDAEKYIRHVVKNTSHVFQNIRHLF